MPKLLRNTVLAFFAGWISWFWLDKQGPAYRMAASLPRGNELSRDLQIGFDLLKAGEAGPAFVYLWDSHYLLLSLLCGALLSVGLGSASRLLARLKTKRRPEARIEPEQRANPPET